MRNVMLVRSVLFLMAVFAGIRADASEEYGLAVKNSGGRVVRYFADHALEKGDGAAEYAIVQIHGFPGGACDCTSGFRSFVGSRVQDGKMYFVAPCFPIRSMLEGPDEKRIVYWDEDRWQQGCDSPVAKELSPYDVLDRIFQVLNDPKLYPGLRHVLFCGYSAGGQIVSRYFAVAKIKPRKGLTIDFAAGAPSTWLYFDEKRVVAGRNKPKVPNGDCKGYDNWHFGLNGRCRYAAGVSDSLIKRNVQSRYLLCFCGTEDTDGENLSRRRGAMVQGATRIERFRNYRTCITASKNLSKSFRFVEVEGLGHDGMCYGHDAVVDLALGIRDGQSAAPSTVGGQPKETLKSGREWERVSPESCRFDSHALDVIPGFIKSRDMGTTGLMIVVGGKVIYTFGDVREVSYIASCRKSVLSMLYGKYVRDGTIRLGETVGELGIDDVGGLLPIEKTATVYDLISARSGCYHPAANAGGIPEGKEMPRGKTKPGTTFVYNNWDFNVAGTVFEQKTGKSIYDVFEKDIAIPLGLQDWDRSRHQRTGDASKSIHLAYHFKFSTRDMARIGELMLRQGKWNGRQLVPADWVEESTSPVTKFGRGGGYGYMWWLLSDSDFPEAYVGAFAAHGRFGQHITVMPALDMVIAHKSALNQKHPTKGKDYDELVRRIVAASPKGRRGREGDGKANERK